VLLVVVDVVIVEVVAPPHSARHASNSAWHSPMPWPVSAMQSCTQAACPRPVGQAAMHCGRAWAASWAHRPSATPHPPRQERPTAATTVLLPHRPVQLAR
jgi:hypothetical protein